MFLLIYAGNITALVSTKSHHHSISSAYSNPLLPQQATCAREVFAFARDKGIPFSAFAGKMDKSQIPSNAVYIVSVSVCLLSLINLGSTLAFNIIVSLSLLGLLSTYMISIGCVLLKRIKGEPLPHARWSLGKYGLAINAFAFVYSAFIIVMSCFPTTLPIDAASMNYAVVVWVGVAAISVAFYVVYGKKHYTAPVEFVEGRRAEGVALQSS